MTICFTLRLLLWDLGNWSLALDLRGCVPLKNVSENETKNEATDWHTAICILTSIALAACETVKTVCVQRQYTKTLTFHHRLENQQPFHPLPSVRTFSASPKLTKPVINLRRPSRGIVNLNPHIILDAAHPALPVRIRIQRPLHRSRAAGHFELLRAPPPRHVRHGAGGKVVHLDRDGLVVVSVRRRVQVGGAGGDEADLAPGAVDGPRQRRRRREWLPAAVGEAEACALVGSAGGGEVAWSEECQSALLLNVEREGVTCRVVRGNLGRWT